MLLYVFFFILVMEYIFDRETHRNLLIHTLFIMLLLRIVNGAALEDGHLCLCAFEMCIIIS